MKRDSGAKHFNNPSSTTQRTAITTSPFGSSRAVIRFVSTVPPIPFGSRSTTNNNRSKSPGFPNAVNPTNNPVEDPRKVTVRTVLRRPPIRIQSTRTGSETGNDSKSGSGLGGGGAAGATTLRSETPWTPINSTVGKNHTFKKIITMG